jgi:hypothetical protein
LWMAVDLLEYQQWWDTIRLSCSSDPVDLVAQAALPSKIQSMDTGLIQSQCWTCTQKSPWNESLGPRTSLAKSINGDTYSTVQGFCNHFQSERIEWVTAGSYKGSTGLIPGLAAKRLEMINLKLWYEWCAGSWLGIGFAQQSQREESQPIN